MLWCAGSPRFSEQLDQHRTHQLTSDGREVEGGDELLIELGNTDVDATAALARAHRAGATVLCCACEQIAALFGGAPADRPRRRAEQASWRLQHAPEIIGEAPTLIAALEMAERVARFDCPVLITGESGTGKELLAKAIHRGSPRAKAPFVPVNCPAIPKELFESELFGHTKGAFTGAVTTREGRFTAADKGTLFLDEIGELDLDMQSKLLRVLQDFEVTPVGEARGRRVDVRVIAATNRDLEQMTESGRFRLDLLFRLDVVQIHLPALRDRAEDVELLLEHHLDASAERLGVQRPQLDAELTALLRRQRWAGNIRQLRNLAERLAILCTGRAVCLSDLPASLRSAGASRGQGSAPAWQLELSPEGVDLRRALQELEDQLIRQAVLATGGNKNRAAKLLGLNRTTLVEKLRKQPELVA